MITSSGLTMVTIFYNFQQISTKTTTTANKHIFGNFGEAEVHLSNYIDNFNQDNYNN